MPAELVKLLVVAAFTLLWLGGIACLRYIDRAKGPKAWKVPRPIEQHWSHIAQRTGLQLLQDSPYGFALYGELDGTPVWFGLNAIVEGSDLVWGICAELPPLGGRLCVWPRGEPITVAFAPAVPTGDEEFDLVYTLYADDAEDARQRLSSAARRALLALGPDTLYVSPCGMMELTVPFDPMDLDETRIAAVLELVRALAQPLPPRAHVVN
jgi:hypothetical protein